MRIRRWVMSGMLALALSLPAMAAEYVIDEDEPQAGNTYPTLDALNSAGVLRPGDSIILHNNDSINLAPGKFFAVDSLDAKPSGVTITGGGTLVTGGGSAGTLTIDNGRVHFKGYYWDDSGLTEAVIKWDGDNIHVGSNGVFKTDAGSGSFNLDSFTADPGARLEIGGVHSGYGNYNSGVQFIVTDTDPANNSGFGLSIDNDLMNAHFEEQRPGEWNLVVGNIRDLATLDGVGSYADMYRNDSFLLSDVERDMLDSIYARGGTEFDKGFLQTVGGVIVQNSLLAVREHNANIATRIHRRLTAYQDEELENIPADLESVTSESLADCYDDCGDDGENFYNESWAFLDHGRSSQDDKGDVAAYNMNTTTLAIGHDWHADQWIYGGMLSYATGAMKLSNQGATRNEYDFLTAAAYISWAEDGWYLSGVGTATYGWNSAHSAYTLPGITLGSDADFATSALGISLEAGHMLETEFYGIPLRITPYGSLAYSVMSRDSVSDTGARNAALDIDLRKQFRAADWNTWDAAIGLRLAVPMRVNEMTVVPSVDISYSRTNGKTTPEGGVAHMYTNPVNSWTPGGLMDSNRGALRMNAGVEAAIREDISLGASYEFEWRKQYWNNRFNVNVSMDF